MFTGDVFTQATIFEAVKALEAANVPTLDGFYQVLAHPTVVRRWQTDEVLDAWRGVRIPLSAREHISLMVCRQARA